MILAAGKANVNFAVNLVWSAALFSVIFLSVQDGVIAMLNAMFIFYIASISIWLFIVGRFGMVDTMNYFKEITKIFLPALLVFGAAETYKNLISVTYVESLIATTLFCVTAVLSFYLIILVVDKKVMVRLFSFVKQ